MRGKIRDRTFLDMGTGSGILAEAASKKKDVTDVVAVDIDPAAIAGLKKRKLKNVKLIQSDLFLAVCVGSTQ